MNTGTSHENRLHRHREGAREEMIWILAAFAIGLALGLWLRRQRKPLDVQAKTLKT